MIGFKKIGPQILPPGIDRSQIRSFQRGTLEHRIARKIAGSSKRAIPFRQYMSMAIDHYYAHRALDHSTGALADFKTDPTGFSPKFGRGVARRIVQMWKELGRPKKFHLVFMGEGNGILARDVLDTLREYDILYACLRVLIVEKSPILARAQRNTLQAHQGVRWLKRDAVFARLPKIEGVVLSNELPDTFPVDQVRLEDGRPQMMFVESCARDEGFTVKEFGEVWRPADGDERISAYSKLARKPLPEVGTVQINWPAVNWMMNVTHSLRRGFHLCFDVGFTGDAYPPFYTNLNTTWDGFVGEDPFLDPGRRDIFSRVDFDVLARSGELAGARTLLNGMIEDFFAGQDWVPPAQPDPDNDSHVEAARLYAPNKWGFLALLQSKGVEVDWSGIIG